MPNLVNIATMATAVDPELDQRVAAALVLGTVKVLSGPSTQDDPTAETPMKDRMLSIRRRRFAFVVLDDPAAQVQRIRWALAAAPLGLLETYLANGSVGINDAALIKAIEVVWDSLAEDGAA
jgi:hypothetical protein